MNQRILFTADTCMSAVSDLAILSLPIPLTWSLKVPLKKKLKIIALLGAGGVATASSIVRLVLVVYLGDSTDLTTSFVRFNLLGYALHHFSSHFKYYNLLIDTFQLQFRGGRYWHYLYLSPCLQRPLHPLPPQQRIDGREVQR